MTTGGECAPCGLTTEAPSVNVTNSLAGRNDNPQNGMLKASECGSSGLADVPSLHAIGSSSVVHSNIHSRGDHLQAARLMTACTSSSSSSNTAPPSGYADG